MTYTTNLQLTHANAPTSSSGTIGQQDTILFLYANNAELLDSYMSDYYTYNVLADSNISITANSLFINITDTGVLLTTAKTLTITSDSVKQLRIIKNSTAQQIFYGSNTVQVGSSIIVYNDTVISTFGNIYIQDIYTYVPGKPAINTILMNKRVSKNSILSGGSAKANIASTSVAVYDIWLDTNKVGYVRFTAGSSIGTVATFGTVFVDGSQNLYIKTQGVQDATLADIGIVLNIIGE